LIVAVHGGTQSSSSFQLAQQRRIFCIGLADFRLLSATNPRAQLRQTAKPSPVPN